MSKEVKDWFAQREGPLGVSRRISEEQRQEIEQWILVNEGIRVGSDEQGTWAKQHGARYNRFKIEGQTILLNTQPVWVTGEKELRHFIGMSQSHDKKLVRKGILPKQ